MLCLVDDAHWTDRPSREVLEFVARRLDTEPIALVLTSRTAEHPPGVLELPLRALDREAATRLLIERTGSRLSAAERDAVLDATAEIHWRSSNFRTRLSATAYHRPRRYSSPNGCVPFSGRESSSSPSPSSGCCC